jgi:hypothetical protein
MKKLFLSVMLVAFAMAVNAGEGKDCDKAGACSSGKKVSTEAKAACPASAKQVKAKAGCCPLGAKAKTTVAKVDSPKAQEQARN